MKTIAIWGLVSIAACLLAWPISTWKNRDHSTWMAWCFILPPALVLLLILPRRRGAPPRRRTLDEIDRIEDHA